MNFPRYWIRVDVPLYSAEGRPGQAMCWGWSDSSLADAEAQARARAERLAQALRAGSRPNRYLYADRPLREEVLDEMRDGSNRRLAIVSRNSYGCRVLNTANVMFVDVDLPEEQPRTGGSLLGRLFGKPAPAPAAPPAETAALARVESFLRENPQLGARLYRTKAGLRYLFTHGPADPAANTTIQIMNALGADPLYTRLCQAQKSFRARLTPKPWRCGLRAARVRWPWPDSQAEARFRAWEANYQRASAGYATCRLLQVLGREARSPEITAIVELHDRLTQATSALPLA
jgi:hypothetical protein